LALGLGMRELRHCFGGECHAKSQRDLLKNAPRPI
jgi:hypothetical protein